MTMDNNTVLQQYYKELKKALRISPKGKKLILQSVEADIAEYIEEYPNATLADLESQFGTPEASHSLTIKVPWPLLIKPPSP